MKTLTLVIDDVDAELCPDILSKLQASVRNVRIHEGYLVNRLNLRSKARFFMEMLPKPADDWRPVYEKYLQRLFPHAWVYRGGHHLAVHASPPAEPTNYGRGPQGEAGRVLFRVIEVKRLEPLACGLHHGEVAGGPCWKCKVGIPQKNAAQARDRALIAAVESQ